jgi:hypothetical protein
MELPQGAKDSVAPTEVPEVAEPALQTPTAVKTLAVPHSSPCANTILGSAKNRINTQNEEQIFLIIIAFLY